MNKLFKISYAVFIYAFLYIPIAVVVWFSFNNADRSLLWHGFTWHWYGVLFQDSDMFTITLHSLAVGTLAATFAMILGTFAAVCFYRYRFFGKKLFFGLLFILVIQNKILPLAIEKWIDLIDCNHGKKMLKQKYPANHTDLPEFV